MQRVFAFSVVATALASCVTELPPVEPPKAIAVPATGSTATIFLNRINAVQLGHTVADALLDGKKIGTISNGQCVRLTIPSGSHNLQLTKGIFGNLGGALGNAVASSFKLFNVKIENGQTLHYLAGPHYEDYKTGWIFTVKKQATGRTC